MTSSIADPSAPNQTEALLGRTFELNGARYTLGPVCEVAGKAAVYAVNDRTGLALHCVRLDAEGLSLEQQPHLLPLEAARFVGDAQAQGGAESAANPLAGLFLEPAETLFDRLGDKGMGEIFVGDRFAAAGLPSVAGGYYQRVLGRNPLHTEARQRMATIQVEMRDPMSALTTMRQVVTSLEPHWPTYYALYLTAAAQAGRFADAAASYTRARALFPYFNGLDAIGAPLLVEAGRPELAAQVVGLYDETFPNREQLDKALEQLMPVYAEANEKFAQARETLFAQGTAQDVSGLLLEAHQRLPMHGLIAFNLALALQRLDRYQESGELILQNLGRLQTPLMPTALLNLAHASFRLGKTEEAAAQLAETYRLLINDSEGNPLARANELPSLCVWVDEQVKVESPVQAVLELINAIGATCQQASITVPAELPVLLNLYQAAAHNLATLEEQPALGTLAELNERGGVEALAAVAAENAAVAAPVKQMPAVDADSVSFEDGSLLPGSYEVQQQVGEGTLGPIYLVRSLITRQFLLAERLSDPTPERRTALWAGLRVWLEAPLHANLLAGRFVRTIGQDIVVFYEAIEGANVAGLLRQGSLYQVPPEGASANPAAAVQLTAQILSFALQSAWALEVVHQQRVVHASVEPESFFVQHDGKVRLGGFWRSRLLGEDAARRHYQSEEQQAVVDDDDLVLPDLLDETLQVDLNTFPRQTGPWTAPELLAGGRLSRETDVWGWAALVLRSLFEGCGVALPADPQSALAQLRQEQGSPGRFATLPAAFTDVLAECLANDADKRPGRLNTVVETLKGIYTTTCGAEFPALAEVTEGLRGGFGSSSLPPASAAFGPWAFLRAGVLDEERARPSIPVGWCDLRYAIAGSYPAEAFQPLLARSFSPLVAATTRGQALADLTALELPLATLRDSAEDDADRALELARGLHDVAVLRDSLGDDAGALAALSESIAWFDSFAAQEDDSEVVLDLVNTLLVYAVCLGRVGRQEAALEQALRALKVGEAMPSDEQAEMRTEALARSFVVYGSLQVDTEEGRDQALDNLERGITAYTDLGWRDEQGIAHAFKAMALQKLGQQEEAIAAYLVADQFLAEEVEGDNGARARRMLGHTALNTFSLYMQEGELIEAERASAQALTNYIQLADQEGHSELAGELAASCKARAAIAEMNRDMDQALQLCTRGRQILEMVIFEGGVQALTSQLALMLRYEADILRRASMLEPSAEVMRRALWLLEQVVARESDPDWQLAVADLRKSVGTVLQQQGRAAEALPLLESSVATARESGAFAPLYEAETYAVLGAAYTSVAQPTQAFLQFAAGLDELDAVSEEDEDEVPVMAGRLQWFQACSQAMQGDLEAAEAGYRTTIASWEPLYDEDPESFEDTPALVQAYVALGMLMRLRGAYGEAAPLYARSVELAEYLVETQAGNVALSTLVLACGGHGVFLTTQGEFEAAAEAYERAASVAELLAESDEREKQTVTFYQTLAERSRDLLELDADKAQVAYQDVSQLLDASMQAAPSGLLDTLRRSPARASLLGLVKGRLEIGHDALVVLERLLAFEPRLDYKTSQVRALALTGLTLLDLGQVDEAEKHLTRCHEAVVALMGEAPEVACEMLLMATLGRATIASFVRGQQAEGQAVLAKAFEIGGARFTQQQLDTLNAVKQVVDHIVAA